MYETFDHKLLYIINLYGRSMKHLGIYEYNKKNIYIIVYWNQNRSLNYTQRKKKLTIVKN